MHRFRRRRKTEKGFTVIEVLIVLAIAGMILLIVFLAVPALQRNSRNTRRRQDVRMIAAAREEYDVTYHALLIPGQTTCTDDTDPTFGNFCDYVQNLTIYDASGVTIVNNGTTAPSTVPDPSLEEVVTESYLRCNGNTPTTTGATSHSVAVVFAIETASGPLRQCLDAGVVSGAP